MEKRETGRRLPLSHPLDTCCDCWEWYGANTLACIVIGRKKNANLFMLFIAISFISIFVVLGLFGAVFSFFARQATTPYRRKDNDW